MTARRNAYQGGIAAVKIRTGCFVAGSLIIGKDCLRKSHISRSLLPRSRPELRTLLKQRQNCRQDCKLSGLVEELKLPLADEQQDHAPVAATPRL